MLHNLRTTDVGCKSLEPVFERFTRLCTSAQGDCSTFFRTEDLMMMVTTIHLAKLNPHTSARSCRLGTYLVQSVHTC